MWRLVTRLLQIVLVIATAAALFVVGAVLTSPVGGGTPPDVLAVDQPDARVEVRVSSRGGSAHLFAGEPLVVDVVLLNASTGDAASELPLDTADVPWEQRLELDVRAADDSSVLNDFVWTDTLLGPAPTPSGRTLGAAPTRATFVLDSTDLAALAAGPYTIHGALSPELVAVDDVRSIPLTVTIAPAPTRDVDRARVSLAVAQAHALRGRPEAAGEAALTALALDPLLDEALLIVAEAWEERGDLDRAIEWYGRYLDTIPVGDADRRAALEAYVDALKGQM
jgi:tetratricopeptide (TPR) repeat protein